MKRDVAGDTVIQERVPKKKLGFVDRTRSVMKVLE